MIERKGVKERNGEKWGGGKREKESEVAKREERKRERELLCRAGFLRSQY